MVIFAPPMRNLILYALAGLIGRIENVGIGKDVDGKKALLRGLVQHRHGDTHRSRLLHRGVAEGRAEFGPRLDHRDIGVLVEARKEFAGDMEECIFLADAVWLRSALAPPEDHACRVFGFAGHAGDFQRLAIENAEMTGLMDDHDRLVFRNRLSRR
jgi:hypothetical protein